MGEGEGASLEDTPTWVVASVCTVIVVISLGVERFLHYLGKLFKRKNQKPLYEALQKIKEELMLLGFISLLLTVCQNVIAKFCISKELASKGLPCTKEEIEAENGTESESESTTAHFQHFSSFISHRFLSEELSAEKYCASKGMVPLLSTKALHHLHIFIFVLAVAHVTFCALTIIFGGAKIRQWEHWENSIVKDGYDAEEGITHVHDHDFIRGRFLGIGKRFDLLSWLQSFCKQFYGSVTQSDYTTLRIGFIMNHCRGNPKFDFHKYMMRALEADFKKVVGISWYLWLFVVVFLLLNANVQYWHAYFYLAFIPFILLLVVGMKLEHIITQLASEVAEKHVAIEGDLVVRPSDDHFWFKRPRLVLLLIHIILFQNSFDIAVFFWIWIQYKLHSCMMGELIYVVPRLVVGVFVQFLCSYSTLPLYALVAQMGSSFKKEVFDEQLQQKLVGWAKQAKDRTALRKAAGENGNGDANSTAIGGNGNVDGSSTSHSTQEPKLEESPFLSPSAVELTNLKEDIVPSDKPDDTK